MKQYLSKNMCVLMVLFSELNWPQKAFSVAFFPFEMLMSFRGKESIPQANTVRTDVESYYRYNNNTTD